MYSVERAVKCCRHDCRGLSEVAMGLTMQQEGPTGCCRALIVTRGKGIEGRAMHGGQSLQRVSD